MDSLEFRQKMINSLRAFEYWAWKDCCEHPEDWNDPTFEEWQIMFNDYLGNQ
jgi:hypothetical protein